MPDRVDGYATAMFEVAQAEDLLERAEEELFAVARALEAHDELRQTLTDESLPVDKRLAIVDDLLKLKASPVTVNLVSFVVGVGRARDLPKIIDRFVERAAAERQHEVAEVRSAIPLDDGQRKRVAEALSKALDKQVEVKVIVDPSVLGGISARVGDTVIDGTVRNRLDQLKELL